MRVRETLADYRHAYAQGFKSLARGVFVIIVALFGLLFLTVSIPLVAPRKLRG